jgi:hypothetical protein
MSKAIRASVLVLLLTCSAQAGWIQNESPAPPPSQPATTIQEPTTGGEMNTPVSAPTADGHMQNDAAAAFVQVMLNLLALS